MIRVGERVERFHIRAELGTGGMGTVYVAWDERLEREVAIKVLRHEVADSEARARLLREARILSKLRHPSLCEVHELFEYKGDSLLVMELVQGEDLSRLDPATLDRDTKLRIARDITSALVAAHALGVVHRDLKLGNIRLRGDGQVKVLDFGLARTYGEEPEVIASVASPSSIPNDRFETGLGVLIGTAIAMSPEQARGETATSASDIYSLGLLLQQLFTGEAPYEPNLTWPQLIVRAQDGAVRPVRGVEREIAELVESMRALAPADRPTARAVLERIEWLLGRRARRVRRAAAAALVVLVLAAGVAYTLALARQRTRALAARDEARTALASARAARAEAEEVTDFLVGLFRGADPLAEQGRAPTLRELLDRGTAEAQSELRRVPSARARLLTALARTYRNLGDLDRADELIVQALGIWERIGASDAVLAEALHVHGSLLRERHASEAIPTLERALGLRELALGETDSRTGDTVNEIAVAYAEAGDMQQALPRFERALAIRRLQPELTSELAKSLANMAGARLSLGDFAAAETLLREAIQEGEKLGEASPDLATSLGALAYFYDSQKRWREAEPLHRRALASLTRSLGPHHPRVALIELNAGLNALELGRFEEAERLLRSSLEIRLAIYGERSLPVANALDALADLHMRTGRQARALEVLQRELAVRRALERPEAELDALRAKITTATAKP